MKWNDITIDLLNDDVGDGDLEINHGDDKWNEGETYMVDPFFSDQNYFWLLVRKSKKNDLCPNEKKMKESIDH